MAVVRVTEIPYKEEAVTKIKQAKEQAIAIARDLLEKCKIETIEENKVVRDALPYDLGVNGTDINSPGTWVKDLSAGWNTVMDLTCPDDKVYVIYGLRIKAPGAAKYLRIRKFQDVVAVYKIENYDRETGYLPIPILPVRPKERLIFDVYASENTTVDIEILAVVGERLGVTITKA